MKEAVKYISSRSTIKALKAAGIGSLVGANIGTLMMADKERTMDVNLGIVGLNVFGAKLLSKSAYSAGARDAIDKAFKAAGEAAPDAVLWRLTKGKGKKKTVEAAMLIKRIQ